ncbi:hypothetical protein Cgig2_017513 [Carnegiea gigantea]|uniref:Uncharacterized protein n=1 Tax=Carnegiea gigantea TaxID=171969 RepID=A0A9Q1K426_9CARY|nr:hypothetical protein Cgig2_017513 [Carnegiea gigantea]
MAPENQVYTKPSTPTHDLPPAPKEPSLACGSEREPLVVGRNDPIEPYISGGVEFREKRCKDRWFPTIHQTTNSYIWKELSIQERDAKTDGFQQQCIRQLMQLNEETKMKRSFPESMERVGQLTGKNIRRLFMKEKLNCKRNRHTWHQKTKRIPNLWHQPMALLRPLRNHLTTKVHRMGEKNPGKRRPWRRILKRPYAAHNFDEHY